jgi:hypothetical protein
MVLRTQCCQVGGKDGFLNAAVATKYGGDHLSPKRSPLLQAGGFYVRIKGNNVDIKILQIKGSPA